MGYGFRVQRSNSSTSCLYCMVLSRSTDVNSLTTILVSQNDPTRGWSPLRAYKILFFASYFSQPISLKNPRNLLRRFQRNIFYSVILLFCKLVKCIVQCYVILYSKKKLYCTWESIDMDNGRRTTDDGQ